MSIDLDVGDVADGTYGGSGCGLIFIYIVLGITGVVLIVTGVTQLADQTMAGILKILAGLAALIADAVCIRVNHKNPAKMSCLGMLLQYVTIAVMLLVCWFLMGFADLIEKLAG